MWTGPQYGTVTSGKSNLGDTKPRARLDFGQFFALSFRNPLSWCAKICGIGLFYRNYRLLLEETLCLGAGLIVCLETHGSGSKNLVSICRNFTVQLHQTVASNSCIKELHQILFLLATHCIVTHDCCLIYSIE